MADRWGLTVNGQPWTVRPEIIAETTIGESIGFPTYVGPGAGLVADVIYDKVRTCTQSFNNVTCEDTYGLSSGGFLSSPERQVTVTRWTAERAAVAILRHLQRGERFMSTLPTRDRWNWYQGRAVQGLGLLFTEWLHQVEEDLDSIVTVNTRWRAITEALRTELQYMSEAFIALGTAIRLASRTSQMTDAEAREAQTAMASAMAYVTGAVSWMKSQGKEIISGLLLTVALGYATGTMTTSVAAASASAIGSSVVAALPVLFWAVAIAAVIGFVGHLFLGWRGLPSTGGFGNINLQLPRECLRTGLAADQANLRLVPQEGDLVCVESSNIIPEDIDAYVHFMYRAYLLHLYRTRTRRPTELLGPAPEVRSIGQVVLSSMTRAQMQTIGQNAVNFCGGNSNSACLVDSVKRQVPALVDDDNSVGLLLIAAGVSQFHVGPLVNVQKIQEQQTVMEQREVMEQQEEPAPARPGRGLAVGLGIAGAAGLGYWLWRSHGRR